MELKELLQFINKADKNLKEKFGHNSTEKERVLARTVKVTEELGELCEEILAYYKDQRKEKLDNLDKDNLSDEFADVVIVTLLLAKAMDIDIEKALENKIAKIEERDYGNKA